MRWFASDDDPIDAVLNDEPVDDDLFDVAVVVHDIRAAYLPDEPLRRSEALTAFTDAHLDARRTEDTGRKRNRMLTSISGFVGTLTGKAVLGTALAAASVGTMHAADVVDVPGLPANDRPAAEAPADAGGSGAANAADAPADAGAAGQMTAAEKQAAAEAHATAVQEWTDCVADAAAARGDGGGSPDGAFDPREACGDMPEPGDFGLTDLPAQAADAARATEGTPGATAVPSDPGANAPAGAGTAPASPGGASDGPAATAPAPTQPDAVPEDPAANAPAGGGPADAPTDAGAGRRP